MANLKVYGHKLVCITWRDSNMELHQTRATSRLEPATIQTVGFLLKKKPGRNGYYLLARDLLGKDARGRISIPKENVIHIIRLQPTI